jgi:hypothetical protein
MPDNGSLLLERPRCTPSNKGKLIGAKPPLRPKHVWAIRTRLMVEGRTRDLAMFNVANCAATARSLSVGGATGHSRRCARPKRKRHKQQRRDCRGRRRRAAGRRPGRPRAGYASPALTVGQHGASALY